MLVFQRDFEHPCSRAFERLGLDEATLVRYVAEINLYLPDDWRMTRTRNNFRVQLVLPNGSAALVGWSFRAGEKILHIIDTVHGQCFHDNVDLKATGSISRNQWPDREFRAEHSEVYTPNLYFFVPCPDDSRSPVFARQYEKVRIDNGKQHGVQYHRIHPLSKAGLDLTHFRWVRWNTRGEVDFVDFPAAGYHGKDYWVTPSLSTQTKRANVARVYVEDLRRRMNAHHIVAAPPETDAPPAYEPEWKYTFHGKPKVFYNLVKEIQTLALKSGYRVEGVNKYESQRDIYLDDEARTLLNAGISLRVRQIKERHARITLKKRTHAADAEHLRIEEDAVISRVQMDQLLAGKPVNTLPFRLLSYIAPACRTLGPVLTVNNDRTTLVLKDAMLLRAEVCHDSVSYEANGRFWGPHYEIEVESRGMLRDSVEEVAQLISSSCPDLQRCDLSKYERGMRVTMTRRM